MSTPRERAERIVSTVREHADGIVQASDRQGRASLRALLRDLRKADDTLSQRLLTIRGDRRFTHAQALAARAQIRHAIVVLQRRLAPILEQQSEHAITSSTRATVELIDGLETTFSGVASPLRLREASLLDVVRRGAEASLLRRHETSIERYGEAMIGEFERSIRLGLLRGASGSEMVAELGTMFGLRRSWAWRIVRTECLPGDTRVDAAVVRAAHRRWYEGPMVEIVTERGRKLSATPNHPMLTGRGWFGAGLLHEGDHLICRSGKQNPRTPGDEHVDRSPTTLREIYDAVSAVGVVERRRGAEPDFHGDGRDGEVYVARPDRPLRIGVFSPLFKHHAERILSTADLARARFCAGCEHWLAEPHERCFCGRSQIYTGVGDTTGDQAVADTERCSKSLHTLSVEVAPHNLGDIYVVTPAGVGPARDAQREHLLRTTREPFGAHEPHDHVFGDVEALCNDSARQAREVELDCVRSVSLREFRGHVYNLSTPHGYYAIDGAYTGNTASAYNDARLIGLHETREEHPHIGKKILAFFDQRTAYDSVMVHGQIRALEDSFIDGAGRVYLMPPSRPNDRETVIPWMLDGSWEETPSTSALPPSTVRAARERAARHVPAARGIPERIARKRALL